MKQITKAQWERIPATHKGEWTQGIWNYRHDFPTAWIGRKTVLASHPEHGTALLTEGVQFEII